ncbi:MAG: hypothetical protein KAS32_22580, partial [Candidatus Peribacteraceae bacterium]|nr:hypothetical protein [Candidatus Peribacteraceae bacterium]
TVGNVAGVVTITAGDLGTIGAAYGVEVSALPGGMTSITVADGASGTGTPSVTDVMDLVGDIRYQGILWPNDLKASAATEVIDFLDARFNVSNDIQDGVVFVGYSDTLANTKTAVNALNSQSAQYMGNAITGTNALKKGPEVMHPADWIAAEFMAIRARRLTENASIGSAVAATASGDQFGGKALASLPYFNTPLIATPVTLSPNVFSQIEQTELNAAGFTVVGPNRPKTETIMGAAVSTYKTDTSGNADVSYKYLNYIDTASICREFFFVNLASLFNQSRLTDGDLLPNRSMENAPSIKGVVLSLFAVLKDAALIRKGRVADKLISDSLTVTLDLANRKATIASVLPIVTQLETINATLQLTFEL